MFSITVSELAGATTPEIIESGLARGPHSKRASKHAPTASLASSRDLAPKLVAASTGLPADLIVETEAIVSVVKKQPKVTQRKATKAEADSAALATGLIVDAGAIFDSQEQQPKPKQRRGKKPKDGDLQEGPTVMENAVGDKGSPPKKRRRAAGDNSEEAGAQQDANGQEAAKPRKARARKVKVEAGTGDEGGEALPSQEGEVEVKKARRARIERATYGMRLPILLKFNGALWGFRGICVKFLVG